VARQIAPQLHQLHHRHTSTAIACSSSPAAATRIPEELTPEGTKAWITCSERLTVLGVAEEKIHVVLKRAFGWGKSAQGFWRGEKENVVPSTDAIDGVLEYLETELGIADEADQAKLIVAFPEVLGLSLELMQTNVGKLQSLYKMKGTALSNAIKRKPRVLGSIVDCEGSCEGWCSRCFAQF
jgi:hypothetical protein